LRLNESSALPPQAPFLSLPGGRGSRRAAVVEDPARQEPQVLHQILLSLLRLQLILFLILFLLLILIVSLLEVRRVSVTLDKELPACP